MSFGVFANFPHPVSLETARKLNLIEEVANFSVSPEKVDEKGPTA